MTRIGHHAFRGCTGLTTITVPSSVTSIGNYAFSGCAGLTTIDTIVTAPSSLTSIGDGAFEGCTGLADAASAWGFANVEEWVNHRLVVAPCRFSVIACVGVARRQKYEGLGQVEPVSKLLESLGDVPDDILRVIVSSMGVSSMGEGVGA